MSLAACALVPLFILEITRTYMGRSMLERPISTRSVMSEYSLATLWM